MENKTLFPLGSASCSIVDSGGSEYVVSAEWPV